MLKKQKLEELLICLLFVMQLGFHTNAKYDDEISLIVTVGIFLYFCLFVNPNNQIFLNRSSKRFLLWYSLMVCLSFSTLLFCDHTSMLMLSRLITETYVPLVLCSLCFVKYIKKYADGKALLKMLIYAEIIVCIRALLHTPIVRLINELNTTLYGTGLGVNYNHFTTSMTLIFCIALYLIFYCQERINICTAFLAFNILLAGSRKAILISLICFVWMYLMTSDRKSFFSKLKKYLLIIVITTVAITLIFTNEFLYDLLGNKLIAVISTMGKNYEEMSAAGLGDDSTRARAILRETAWSVFKEHPILGVGYYGFRDFNRWGYYAHNNFLEVLADFGVIGFIIYYMYYILQIKFAFKQTKCNKHFSKTLRPDILVYSFMLVLLIMEYAQVTFFRIYVLLPLLAVSMSFDCLRIAENDQNSSC